VIAHVAIEEVKNSTKADKRPVVYFEPNSMFHDRQGHPRGLVLNKTNAKSIAALYGAETDKWIGQPVILFPHDYAIWQ